VLLVAAVALVVLSPAPAHAETPVDVRAITGLAGKCVDVAGANTADGTSVQLYSCNGTAAQQWSVNLDGTIRALGKCLDEVAGGTVDGTRVQLHSCNGSAAQQWRPSAGTLVNPQSGRCLDATNRSSADGTPLQIWSCVASSPAPENQTWSFIRQGQMTGIEGKCADVAGANPAAGTPLQLWTCNGTDAQHLWFPADGTVRVLGECLDLLAGQPDTSFGTYLGPRRVVLAPCSGERRQGWYTYRGSTFNNNAGGCLRTVNDASTDGTPLETAGGPCLVNAAAQWTFVTTQP